MRPNHRELSRRLLGYVVLTPTQIRNKKGEVERVVWNPDWDGLLHEDRNQAFTQLDEARVALGEVILARCVSEYEVIHDGAAE